MILWSFTMLFGLVVLYRRCRGMAYKLNATQFSSLQMWACALGHMEAAVVLYKWDRRALVIPDSLGRLPLAIARSRGHTKLAECLESLQREEQQSGALNTTPSMPFSPSTEASASEGWMNVWGSETSSVGLKGSNITSSASSSSSGENWKLSFYLDRQPSTVFYVHVELRITY